tara:strand:- start:55 stop:753 length:699 start_codon:yes stop_codon:yes gene_type:complete
MAIIDYNDPFILWASARTASTDFFYEYSIRNNCKTMHMNHEPLNLEGVRAGLLPSGGILEVVSQKYSFKCMVNTYTSKKNQSIWSKKGLYELSKLKNAIPAMNYNHIIIHRKDLYAREKSYLFSQQNNVWSKKDLLIPREFVGWMNLSDKELRWKEEHAIKFEKEVLDKYVELINIFDEYEIPYQIVEFEEACEYIGKDTSQGTKQYYGEWESATVKKQLLKLEDHEFYRRI